MSIDQRNFRIVSTKRLWKNIPAKKLHDVYIHDDENYEPCDNDNFDKFEKNPKHDQSNGCNIFNDKKNTMLANENYETCDNDEHDKIEKNDQNNGCNIYIYIMMQKMRYLILKDSTVKISQMNKFQKSLNVQISPSNKINRKVSTI